MEQPPKPDPELQRLAPLLGSWRVKAQTEDSLAGPAGPVTSDETFYWLDGGYFMVSTYHTVFGNEAAQNGINYWGYDSKTGKFHIIFFSNNGPFTEAGSRYKGIVAKDKLVFTGPARFTLVLDADGKVKVSSDGSITFVWELRDANGTWKHWMDNKYIKVK